MVLSRKQLDVALANLIEDPDRFVARAHDPDPEAVTRVFHRPATKYDDFCGAFYWKIDQLTTFEDKLVSKISLERVLHVLRLTTKVPWDPDAADVMERFITRNLPANLSVNKAKAGRSGFRHLQDLVSMNHINDMLAMCFHESQCSRLADALSKVIANHLDYLQCLYPIEWGVDPSTLTGILKASANLMIARSQRYYKFIRLHIPGLMALRVTSRQIVSSAADARDALPQECQAAVDEIVTTALEMRRIVIGKEFEVGRSHDLQFNLADTVSVNQAGSLIYCKSERGTR